MSDNIIFVEDEVKNEIDEIENPDSTIVKIEQFDIDMASYISQVGGISSEEKKRIRGMMKNRFQGNKLEATYILGKRAKSEFVGRWIIRKGFGLQGLSRDTRNALAKPYYWDLDFKNCQVEMLRQIADKNGWCSKYLTEYCDNREDIFTEIKKTHELGRDDIKQMFIRILFGGEKKVNDPKWVLDNFYPEVNSIMKNIALLYPKEFKMAQKNKPNNPYGCCCANVLQLNGRSLSVLIHDGGYIEKLQNEKEFPNKLITKCQEYVEDVTGFKLILSVKPIETSFTLPNKVVADENKTYEAIKEKFELTHFKCTDKSCFYEVEGDRVIVRKRGDLVTSFEHLKYEELVEKKKGGEMVEQNPFISKWLQDSDIRTYRSVELVLPPRVCPSDTFNLWNGFSIEKYSSVQKTEDVKSGVEGILCHIKYLMNGDMKSFDYFLNWLAQLFQSPGNKIGIAWLFKTVQGIGKGWLFELIKNMVGSRYCILTADPENDLFCSFNDLLENKLIVAFDEMSGKNGFKYNDRIKNMITDPIDKVKTKYLKANSDVLSFSRYLFFTNNEFPIKIEWSDRRFVNVECLETSPPPQSYFQRLWSLISDKDVLKTLFDELVLRDISEVKWIEERPQSEFSNELKFNCISKEVSFIMDLYEENISKHRSTFQMSCKELFECFKDFLKREVTTSTTTYNITIQKFGIALKKLNINGFKKIPGKFVSYEFNPDEIGLWIKTNCN